jgi:hypothetical protein
MEIAGMNMMAERRGRRRVGFVAALVAAAVVAGCSDMSNTQQRVLTGGAGGAAGGALIGAMAGNAALGAGIGAGVGLLGGYIYDLNRRANGQP